MAGKKGGAAPVGNDNAKVKARIDKVLCDENKSLKAFASATVGPFAVHGIRVFEKDTAEGKELFIGMPQNSYKNASGETVYEDIFHPITSESREELCTAVANAYDNALQENENMDAKNEQSKEIAQEFVQKM